MTDSHVRLSGDSNSQLREKWERKVLRGWRTEDRVPRPRLRGTNLPSPSQRHPSRLTIAPRSQAGVTSLAGRRVPLLTEDVRPSPLFHRIEGHSRLLPAPSSACRRARSSSPRSPFPVDTCSPGSGHSEQWALKFKFKLPRGFKGSDAGAGEPRRVRVTLVPHHSSSSHSAAAASQAARSSRARHACRALCPCHRYAGI